MAWMIRLTFLLLLDFKLLEVTAQQTACLPDVRDAEGEERCLSLIREKALDTSGFTTVCLPEPSDDDGCLAQTRFPNQPNSLSMLVFGTPCSVDPLSGLDRYLGVRYNTPPGRYSGCDHEYVQDEIDFELDPLTDLSVDGLVTAQMPQFSWRAERNELFTLIFVTLDRNVLHLALANIRGNDTANALVLRPYAESHPRWYNPLVYGFFLYKQRGLLLPEFVPFADFNITDFVQKHALQGPVGINWMNLNPDLESLEIASGFDRRQFCPLLIQKELEKNSPDLPFLAQPYDLGVHLRVRFTSDRFTYKCGALSITHPGSDFFLNPIGNPILNVADIRTESTRTFSMEMYQKLPDEEIDFTGKLYTLLIVDEQFPFLHGLTINIEGDDVSSGTVIQAYRQPLPPSVHTYYFLLYEQKTEINPAATAGFTQTTCPSNRCLHGVIQAFISLNDLELAGATWMRADQDNYVQCLRNQ